MEIRTLVLGAYQVNCYLVSGAPGRCVVIDPGYQAMNILSAAEMAGWTVEAILLTHGHFDHVGAVKDLAVETDCPVYIHEQELSLPPFMTAGKLHYSHTYAEGDVLELAGLTFTVLHTPGHTPGGVCLQCGSVLFTGDTLFEGSCGRTDFPGSSPGDMRASLARLRDLPANYTVYPGHGGPTTLTAERSYNPYLR